MDPSYAINPAYRYNTKPPAPALSANTQRLRSKTPTLAKRYHSDPNILFAPRASIQKRYNGEKARIAAQAIKKIPISEGLEPVKGATIRAARKSEK